MAQRGKPRLAFVLICVALGVLHLATPARAPGLLDQQQTDVAGEICVSQPIWLGQTFTAGITGMLDQVDLSARQNLAPGVGLPLIVQIRTVNGGFPSTTILSTTTTTVFNS